MITKILIILKKDIVKLNTMGFFVALTIFIAIFATVDLLPANENEERAGCLVDLNHDLTFQHALILKPNSNEFLLPGSNGLRFNPGEKVHVACTGKGNHLKVGSKNAEKILECEHGNIFKIEGEGGSFPFKKFECADFSEPTARKTGQQCAGKYTEIEIGFKVSTGFVKTILVCFNDNTKDSLYSTYILRRSIGDQQIRVPRPAGFEEGEFYPNMYPRPSSLYTSGKEIDTFAKLLKSEAEAKKYVKKDKYFFLSRGHLTAKADFVYGSQQRSTFFYVNVAPQWQVINEENWNALEQDVRSFASKRDLDLNVYTGVWGISTLPDKYHEQTKLYLYYDTRTNAHKITVPEVYWKILYEPESQKGVAFITHNNPYETNVAKQHICKDICNKINWLHWNSNNITLGYSYCCEVDDLKKVVPYIPDFNINGLLV